MSRVAARLHPGTGNKNAWRSQQNVHGNAGDPDVNAHPGILGGATGRTTQKAHPEGPRSLASCGYGSAHPGVTEWSGRRGDDDGALQVSSESCLSDPSSLGEEIPFSLLRVEDARRGETNLSADDRGAVKEVPPAWVMTPNGKRPASRFTAREEFRLPQNGRIEKKWVLNFTTKWNENKYCMGRIYIQK